MLETAARQREAERIQEWEDQLALARQRDLLREDAVKDASNTVQVAEINQRLEEMRRSGAQAESIAQYEKLLRTIEADGIHQRQILAAEEQRLAFAQREREAEWQRELKKMEHERAEKFARWKGEYDLLQAHQSHELRRMEMMGGLSDMAKVATAAAPNAEALTQIMKLQVHSCMTPEQIQATAAVVAAERGVTPEEALRQSLDLLQQDRARRDAELDKDRRHQLDLLDVQNPKRSSL
jgi:hypothetical protein